MYGLAYVFAQEHHKNLKAEAKKFRLTKKKAERGKQDAAFR